MPDFCHVCEIGPLLVLEDWVGGCVTSDCRPCDTPQTWCVCKECGTVQKRLDDSWKQSVADIYSSYVMYGQSDGVEQSVFDQTSGGGTTRSRRLMDKALETAVIPESGRLLDVGCGNGAFLQAFGEVRSKWKLAGSELDGRNRQVVEKLPMVEALYDGAIDGIPGTFDFVSLIHVLEHVVNPRHLLRSVHAKLQSGGLLLIEVPDFEQNPFDLLIADHCTHFTTQSARRLLEATGFNSRNVTADWVPKELSVLAEKTDGENGAMPAPSGADFLAVASKISWLKRVAETAARLAQDHAFGILGTSIAGSWLHSRLAERVAFFVDEDSSRIGRNHMDLPIYAPHQVPAKSTVFIAQPTPIAAKIRERLQPLYREVDFAVPPAL